MPRDTDTHTAEPPDPIDDVELLGSDAVGLDTTQSDFGSTLRETPDHQRGFSTEFGNTLVVSPDHRLPEISQLYKITLTKLAEAFSTMGVLDWAICGSMQKIIAGVQDPRDLPGDIDVVTIVPAVEKFWEMYQQGKLNLGGSVTVHEPESLGIGEKYGKSKMLKIKIDGGVFDSIDIEIFGEGGDQTETVNSYGGSVQLGNRGRHAKIYRVEGDVQILSEQDQRRQYALVLCNELIRETDGGKEKIASRIVSLMQYAGHDPDLLVEDLRVIKEEYKNVPEQLSGMVTNLSTIIGNREKLKKLQQDSNAETSKERVLVPTEVDRLLEVGAEIVTADVFDVKRTSAFLEHMAHIDLDQSGKDYKKLRLIYQGVYTMTMRILEHGGLEEKKALSNALAKLYIANSEPRSLYVLFLQSKVSLAELKRKVEASPL